ncbi:MAG TPA: glutathione S-transferase family protein [Bacteriovoracaceae bacterium]|nr:glutathione S-transferase family protein [Bacteriovoracaceae bacterium]
MTYTLIGSRTSPFVRRIRMLLEHMPYEFKEMNIYDGEEAIALNRINPINQIPVLLDGEKTIWDSRQIFNFLNGVHGFQRLDWKDENLLTALDRAMDSAVSLLLMKRSGMKTDEPFMFTVRQKERIDSVLDYLTPFLKDRALEKWDLHTMTLYALLDWGRYRDLFNLQQRPECLAFLKTHENRPVVTLTAIPKV